MSWEDWFWVVVSLLGVWKVCDMVWIAYCHYSTANFIKHFKEIEEGVLLVQENLWKLRSASVNIDGDDSTEKHDQVVSHLEQLLEWLDKCEVIQENFDLHWTAIGMRLTRGQVTMQINYNIARFQRIYKITRRSKAA